MMLAVVAVGEPPLCTSSLDLALPSVAWCISCVEEEKMSETRLGWLS